MHLGGWENFKKSRVAFSYLFKDSSNSYSFFVLSLASMHNSMEHVKP